MQTADILGHQGGWDEALLIAMPLALLAGLLWLANRRAERAIDHKKSVVDGSSATSPPSTEADRSASDSTETTSER